MDVLYPYGLVGWHTVVYCGGLPADVAGVWVEQGTLLGYQGEYAGNASFGIGLHVHVGIALSEPDGSIKNEALLENTLDLSPYFGMPLNIEPLPTRPIRCQAPSD
jgi:hypothetical protein